MLWQRAAEWSSGAHRPRWINGAPPERNASRIDDKVCSIEGKLRQKSLLAASVVHCAFCPSPTATAVHRRICRKIPRRRVQLTWPSRSRFSATLASFAAESTDHVAQETIMPGSEEISAVGSQSFKKFQGSKTFKQKKEVKSGSLTFSGKLLWFFISNITIFL